MVVTIQQGRRLFHLLMDTGHKLLQASVTWAQFLFSWRRSKVFLHYSVLLLNMHNVPGTVTDLELIKVNAPSGR